MTVARGFVLCALFVVSFGLAEGREVITEPERRTIPAGPGLKPFDVTRHLIPLNEIRGGGPPRDGIPALLNPEMVSAAEANRWLSKNDRVLGVFLNGEARAYPIRILNWHELVNDEIGGEPILVSWCPLCGSAVVYDPRVEGRRLTFGVSGLLWQRNLLMYDRETGSLWSQLLSEAVTGPLAGARLKVLSARHATWAEWKKAYPETRVLSQRTGHPRNYREDPYASLPLDRRLALFVAVGKEAAIFPYSELRRTPGVVTEKIGGREVRIRYDRAANSAHLETSGPEVASYFAFQKDLETFYPDAKVFKARR